MSTDSSEAAPLKSRGFGKPWLIISTVVLLFLASQIAAAIITEILFNLSGKQVDDIYQSTAAQFIFILIAEALVVAAVVWLVRRRGLGLASIGLGRRPQWKDLTYAAAVFIVFFIFLAVLFAVLQALVPEIQSKLEEPQEIGFEGIKSRLDMILAFSSLVILAPVGEEVLVRGYLFSGLRRYWHFLPAAVVTGIIFGAAHLQPGGGALVWGAALSTFVLSLALVYLREKTGALYASILVHSLNNSVAFIVYFTSVGI